MSTVIKSLFACTVCALVSAPSFAEEVQGWEISYGAGVELASKQLTYGLIDNPHAILIPAAEIGFEHSSGWSITVGVEAIFDTTNFGAKDGGYNDRRWKYQELAPGITIAKNWDTSSLLGSSLDTEINYTYEYHPSSCKKPLVGYSNPGSQWLNLGFSLPDYWLVPTLAIEYNLDDRQDSRGGIYATFDVHHEFDIGSTFGCEEGVITLTPILGIAAANKDRNEADFGSTDSFMLRDAYARVECNIALTEHIALTPYLECHQQIASVARDATGDDDFVMIGGIAFSASF